MHQAPCGHSLAARAPDHCSVLPVLLSEQVARSLNRLLDRPRSLERRRSAEWLLERRRAMDRLNFSTGCTAAANRPVAVAAMALLTSEHVKTGDSAAAAVLAACAAWESPLHFNQLS